MYSMYVCVCVSVGGFRVGQLMMQDFQGAGLNVSLRRCHQRTAKKNVLNQRTQ